MRIEKTRAIISSFSFSFLQGTFERVSYEIIGDDAAPVYFQIDSQSGVISVRSSLATASDSVFVSEETLMVHWIVAGCKLGPFSSGKDVTHVCKIVLRRSILNSLLFISLLMETSMLHVI